MVLIRLSQNHMRKSGILCGIVTNFVINAPFAILALFDNPHTVDVYQMSLEKVSCYFPLWTFYGNQCASPYLVFFIWLLPVTFVFYLYGKLRYRNPQDNRTYIFWSLGSFLLSAYPIFLTVFVWSFILSVVVYGFV